jgi:hypothetical protein
MPKADRWTGIPSSLCLPSLMAGGPGRLHRSTKLTTVLLLLHIISIMKVSASTVLVVAFVQLLLLLISSSAASSAADDYSSSTTNLRGNTRELKSDKKRGRDLYSNEEVDVRQLKSDKKRGRELNTESEKKRNDNNMRELKSDKKREEVGLDEAEEDDAKKFCTDELAALWRDNNGVEHNMCAWVNDSTDDDMQVRKCGKFVPLWNDKSVQVQEKLSAEQIESDMKQKSFKGTTVADLCMVSCGKVNIGPVACWGRSRGPRDDPEW